MKRRGVGERVEIIEGKTELDDVVRRRDRDLRASDAVPAAAGEPLDLGVATACHVERELPLRTQPLTHAEVPLIAEERLAAGRAIGVDSDRDVHGVHGRDVHHADEAVEVQGVGGEPHLQHVVVGRHARVRSAVRGDAAQNPLVSR